jgi:maltose/moltooligosaccharide transporter
VLTTREYSPQELRKFSGSDVHAIDHAPLTASLTGAIWLVGGLIVLALVATLALDKQLYVLGGGLAAYGLAQMVNAAALKRGTTLGALSQILSDLNTMPQQMRRLAVVQFFTWIALFILWIYTTPVVTQYVFGSTDTASRAYNGVAALAALILPFLTKRMGGARTHMACLLVGAAAYAAMMIIRDANLLVLPMIGIGIAWASILTMPYVILSAILPQEKFGIYMGIFNFFIVLPQLMIATIMGGIMRSFFPGQPIWTMLVAAIVMAGAALAMLRVDHKPAA